MKIAVMIMIEIQVGTCIQIMVAAQTLICPIHLPVPTTPQGHHHQQQPQNLLVHFHQPLTISQPGRSKRIIIQNIHEGTNLTFG